MRWLVTGSAGFVGAAVAGALVEAGQDVVGIDNLDPYYAPELKRARLARLPIRQVELDIRDADGLRRVWAATRPDVVVHLAAQAGIRDGQPLDYVTTNVVGFANVLECARTEGTGHLVYASSSSVYGAQARLPYAPGDTAGHPVSLYAATKRADELLAHSYSHLYGIPATGLRFFTVYGPWGRPDMAYFRFARAILDGTPVRLFGDGSAVRDFTYIDDIVEGVLRVAHAPPVADPRWDAADPDPATSTAPWRLYNIGHGARHTLRELIATLERLLGAAATVERADPVPGDVAGTEADVTDLEALTGFRPKIDLETGLRSFCDWYAAARRWLPI